MFRRGPHAPEDFRGNMLFRHEYLRVHSSYYRDLHPSLKATFQKRQAKLLRKLRFRALGGVNLNPGMSTLISSAMIQITLGLRQYIPTYFRTVRIAPSSYHHRAVEGLMRGDVNLDRRRITLSWPAVREGFLIEDDAQNTALHEISHFLDLETTVLKKHGHFFDPNRWEGWEQAAIQRIANQLGRPVTRRSAHHNLKELFASTMEIFFERPEALYQLSPPIFSAMSQLLQQDPRNRTQPLLA